MTTALVAMSDMERMAAAFSRSGMFGTKTTEQALALLLLAQAEGQHPAIAMRDFDVIQGRPAKKAEAMLRSFIAAGGTVEWHSMTDELADASFTHPQGSAGKPVRITWDLARAKRAGLATKDNWQKYGRQMLANRVISEGCRRVYPAATSGLYEVGEVREIARQEKDMGRAEVIPAAPEDQPATESHGGASAVADILPASKTQSPAPDDTTAGEPLIKKRDLIALELCGEANINYPDASAKAWQACNAIGWENMSERDWLSWVAMMRRTIARRQARKATEAPA